MLHLTTWNWLCIANNGQAIQSAIQRGELERVLFEGGSDLPDNFDSAEQWPECSKMINDIRDWGQKCKVQMWKWIENKAMKLKGWCLGGIWDVWRRARFFF